MTNQKLKKILVTGARGQLGKKIKDLLGDHYELVLTDTAEMDITDSGKVNAVISKERPDWIIHSAAYTKVDKAEENEALCRRINVAGTENIAKAATTINAKLIYISTDYVFDGRKGAPYVETDRPHPLSVYGQTKYEGELAVRKIFEGTVPGWGQSPNAKNGYYIIRSAWIFGELPKGHPGTNFVETVLRLAKERSSLSVVDDQIGSPTYTQDLVDFIDKIINQISNVKYQKYGAGSILAPSPFEGEGWGEGNDNNIPCGTYHFSGEGACSWYDFAREIFAQSGISIDVKPITSAEYPQKARRPAYSYLSKEKIKSTGIHVRPWQEMLGDYLRNRFHK